MLTDAHASHLAQFRISVEMLEAGGIRSVTDPDTRELLGVRGRCGQDLSGILFPYFDPITGRRTGARVRLDHPDDGMKYLMEEGCRHLYFPGVPAAWLTDTSIPIIAVEAEKSALAIYALAKRRGLKVIPIAIGGCWGWKRKGRKEMLPDGGAKYVSAPSPDFALCTWSGRDVRVLFDSNVASKFEVQWARTEFSKYLQKLGANVLWAEVPVIVGINGPDDFIALATDVEAVERMLEKVAAFKKKQEENSEHRTQTVQLVATVTDIATLFHSEQTGYAIIPINGHDETWRIGSSMFRRHICHWFYQTEGKIPGTQVVLAAVNLLEAKALFEGYEQEVHVRVAEHAGALWLDLANEKWQAVRITKDGWEIIDMPSVRFLRPRGLLPLPIPERGGSIEELRQFLNVASDDDFILVIAFLVAALRPRGPYPVLVIVSEHGSGKTTMSRMIRRLVDPNFAMTRAEPKENRDLAIACRNGHVIALDNISKLQDWLSDTLARISTGDAFATRALYTDAEEVLFAACRPVLLNGITAVPHRPDLLDRCVIVNCAKVLDHLRRPEDKLWDDFQSKEPRILGALLDAVAKALACIDKVNLATLPRMADFAKWIAAAEPALPWKEGRFMKIYGGNRQDAIEQILDSDPVAELCHQIADWEGTATELLSELNGRNPEMTRRKNWYEKPVQVSNHLKNLAPALERVGIKVTWSRGHHPRLIGITKINSEAEGAESSQRSQSPGGEHYQQEAGDDFGDDAPASDDSGAAGRPTVSNSDEKICRDGDDRDDFLPEYFGRS
jgi:hypothetical protein